MFLLFDIEIIPFQKQNALFRLILISIYTRYVQKSLLKIRKNNMLQLKRKIVDSYESITVKFLDSLTNATIDALAFYRNIVIMTTS